MYKINILQEKKEILFELDRQNRKVYDYCNLSRLAALFNFIINDIKIHTCIDEVFEKFISLPNPVIILQTFIKSFENFFYLYVNARFPHITQICFHSTKKPIHDNIPIYCFLQMGILIVSYSIDYLTLLINKTLTLNYLFGKDDTIKEVELSQYNNSYNFDNAINENERNFKKTIDLISLKINKNCLESKSVCLRYNQNQNQNLYYSIHDNDSPSLDCIQNFEEIFQTQQNKYILNNIYSIQKNINEIFCEKNRLHLTYLAIVNHILDTSIQTVLEEVTRTKIEKPVIKIRFDRKNSDSKDHQFIHTNITVRDGPINA